MNILICCNDNVLDNELQLYFKEKQVNFLTAYHKTRQLNTEQNISEKTEKTEKTYIDFTNKEEIKIFFLNKSISVCINCIEENDLNICETNWDYASKINIKLPDNISSVCNLFNVHFIHISSSYVFDGKSLLNYSTDIVNPLQNYGITKIISEIRVKNNCRKHTILRIPLLFTDKNISSNNIINVCKYLLNRTSTFYSDNYYVIHPIHAYDVCKFIMHIIFNNLHGKYHFSNPHIKTTLYEMCKIASVILNILPNIVPLNDCPENIDVIVPKDVTLIESKINIYNYHFTPLNDTIKKLFGPLYHPTLDVNTNKNTEHVFFIFNLNTLLNTLNSEIIISYITRFNINYVIISHYSKTIYENIQHDIEILRILNNVVFYDDIACNTSEQQNENNIIDLYNYGVNKYYKGERYKIGFESSLDCYNRLKNITQCNYFCCENEDMYKNNIGYLVNEMVYIINDFVSLF